jgi:hypothetical protein
MKAKQDFQPNMKPNEDAYEKEIDCPANYFCFI